MGVHGFKIRVTQQGKKRGQFLRGKIPPFQRLQIPNKLLVKTPLKPAHHGKRIALYCFLAQTARGKLSCVV